MSCQERKEKQDDLSFGLSFSSVPVVGVLPGRLGWCCIDSPASVTWRSSKWPSPPGAPRTETECHSTTGGNNESWQPQKPVSERRDYEDKTRKIQRLSVVIAAPDFDVHIMLGKGKTFAFFKCIQRNMTLGMWPTQSIRMWRPENEIQYPLSLSGIVDFSAKLVQIATKCVFAYWFKLMNYLLFFFT